MTLCFHGLVQRYHQQINAVLLVGPFETVCRVRESDVCGLGVKYRTGAGQLPWFKWNRAVAKVDPALISGETVVEAEKIPNTFCELIVLIKAKM